MAFSDWLKILIGWVLGLLTVIVGQYMLGFKERRQLAAALAVEVGENYKVCSLVARVDKMVKEKGALFDEKGNKVPVSLGSLKFLSDKVFKTDVFLATLPQHGLLPKDLLRDLHDFYRRLDQMDQLQKASGDSSNTAEQREGFFRDFLDL